MQATGRRVENLRQDFFQQGPWAAEVQAHELLVLIAEVQTGAEAHLALLKEELLRVVQVQRRAIQPGQIRALRHIDGHARQAAAYGVNQPVAVGLQIGFQLGNRIGIAIARNDVGRVAKIGSVRVVEQFTIEKYSRLQHISSHVEGKIEDGLDAIDVPPIWFYHKRLYLSQLHRYRAGPVYRLDAGQFRALLRSDPATQVS